jgi:glycogen operon protein
MPPTRHSEGSDSALERCAFLTPGARVLSGGTLFSLVSRKADRVWLLLFDRADAEKPSREMELNPALNRQGAWWSVFVPEAASGQLYAYRAESADGVLRPDQWLLDPYAVAVSGRGTWGDADGLEPGRPPRSGPLFPKSVVWEEPFDWGSDRPPRTPLADTVFYETHLRGFTVHPSSGVSAPGTYPGFAEKIPYLKDLGVTAVEFLPVTEFDEMEFALENRGRRDLKNFWGYSPQAFFAPNARYAARPGPARAVVEFKTLVRDLHAAGLEVILDLVFNHTAESDRDGPVWSFKGLDPKLYYLHTPDGHDLANFTGCGNTLNANHPIVQDLILHCLRYWAVQMRVDGFRFDLASALTRDTTGRPMSRPPLLERIAEDPILQNLKLIAEPWDAGGLYQVGGFHPRFSEWNGAFRDDVRRFWAGFPGQLGALATRLCGSSDLYDRTGQTPQRSVNFVTCHDGFTLADLVSYSRRHNKANGEDNRDGEALSYSCNHGVEGETGDPSVRKDRLRHMKNLLATVFLSRGVPLLLAGDEFARTQGGNNNAYSQDNETSWVDWSLLERHAGLQSFVRKLIAFRAAHPVLRRTQFFKGQTGPDGEPPDIAWFGPEGHPPDWTGGLAIACRIDGGRRHSEASREEASLFLAFNAGPLPVRFLLPPPAGAAWEAAWTTQDDPICFSPQQDLPVQGHSLCVLRSPTPEPDL